MTSFYGIYSGTVKQLDSGTWRLKVSIPELLGATALSEWAKACLPPGWAFGLVKPHAPVTDSHGDTETIPPHQLYVPMPNLEDQVWIMFESGHPEYPVWMGLWPR